MFSVRKFTFNDSKSDCFTDSACDQTNNNCTCAMKITKHIGIPRTLVINRFREKNGMKLLPSYNKVSPKKRYYNPGQNI